MFGDVLGHKARWNDGGFGCDDLHLLLIFWRTVDKLDSELSSQSAVKLTSRER